MGDWDLCECIFNHNSAMNRLMEILRDAQDACTDGECTDGSLPEGEQALLGTVGMMAAWVAFAGAMYLARPNSMRPAPNLDEKHSGPGDGGAPRGPEPPAPAV